MAISFGSSAGSGIIDPLLAPLADNGGLTETHALQAGSPAINYGDSAAVAGVGDVPLFDQRGTGFDRVQQGRIDIGAYESPLLPPSAEFDGDGFVTGLDFLAWQRGFGSQSASTADGDADGDLDVDAADLGFWEDQYGTGSAPLVAGLAVSSESAAATSSELQALTEVQNQNPSLQTW